MPHLTWLSSWYTPCIKVSTFGGNYHWIIDQVFPVQQKKKLEMEVSYFYIQLFYVKQIPLTVFQTKGSSLTDWSLMSA